MRNDMITFRVQQILSLPIIQRCHEMNILCGEVDFKQLKECFPVILENIFGTPGWGLRVTDRGTLTLEKDCILKFLDPLGPLFSLAYKLCSDYYLRYELPLTLLPTKLKRELEKGVLMSSWYCERIFMDPQTRRATALKLSPFELLMFRFSLNLLPQLQPDVWIESMYLQLLERYLCHFLPCQMQAGPVEPSVPYTPPSPQSMSPHFGALSSQGQRISLLKPQAASPGVSIHNQHNPLAEIWRTVHIINIFMDVWLTFDDEKGGISPNSLRTISQQPTLPSAEHVRMVRAFLKHLHYFANSACYTNPNDMDEMKKMVIPMFRSKIYHFISGCIKNWPYDQSFRIILEAWLSYIQPWRYINFSNYGLRDNDESGKAVDKRWQTFIAENLPFYGCIFEQTLNRFNRIDLSILKNAQMLQRVCRLLTLENLKLFVSEVEESLKMKGAPLSPYNSRLMDVTDNSFNLKIQSTAQTSVAELEGQLYVYKSIFGSETSKQLREFLRELLLSRQRAETLLEQQQKKPRSNGFWSSLLGMDDERNEEYTVDDRKRVVDLLKICYTNICTIFEIRDMEVDGNVSDILNKSFPSDASIHNNSTFMSTQREPPVPKAGGDPDLQPICSYEVAWLVRMFHDISSYCNKEYHFQIQAFHTREDMWGRISRQVIQPPTTIYVFERNRDGYKARTEKVLPARLSLRKLANKKLLIWLAISCLLAKLFGFHFSIGLILPFLFFCGWIFVGAVRE